ncbi:MAG TPA: 1,2-phenylacetyl-CoA epoxidase subunit PaaD [Candidatus Kapabacteria bacterium]|nr:1,2-phenylacetyl-CoA epoxidase subunit PaaD [Candidatus Kapabacteria bacterium]
MVTKQPVAQPFSAVVRTFSPSPAEHGDGLKVRPTGENAGATDAVLNVLGSVMDPEIPTLSILDLGMITGVAVNGAIVNVRLLPTFVACPATSYIKSNIAEALHLAGFESVQVDLETEMSWTSDRISETGRKKLEAFGLGAPVQIDGILSLDQIEHVSCPHCRSANTELRSMFGSTLCRSIHYCLDCRQGFERFKPL